MLVLTRKSEQKIIIGSGNKRIVVTVLKVEGNQVSLGIEADKDTPIYREEIFEEIARENTSGAVQKDTVDVKELAKNLNLKKKIRRPAKTSKV